MLIPNVVRDARVKITSLTKYACIFQLIVSRFSKTT